MPALHSRIKGILRGSKPNSRTADNKRTNSTSGLDKIQASNPRSKTDELGFRNLVSGIDPVVDIVAIHGLDGHREKTWTASNGILWLRDLLSADMPNARILVYGYDADTRSGECVSTQTIYRHAEKLVQTLSRERSDNPRRPIIFIAHSLGGIVLKQALVLCHVEALASKNQLRDILVSTHAILFFGTPHSGVKGTELLMIMNKLLSVYLKATDAVLQSLGRNSPELENIQNLFTSASAEIEAVHFYEVYKTPILGGQSQMIVPYHSATVAGNHLAGKEALDADHCQMVKFPDANNANYKTVFSYLKKYAEGAADAVMKKWSTEDAYRDLANKGNRAMNGVALPKPRLAVSRNYVDRPGIQSLITQNLLPSGLIRHQARCILHGIGGAGKTQLATNWIREYETRFTRVIFVDASSQSQLEKDLELSIRSLGPEYSKATWTDAVAYLDGREKGWLLFLDNADSPEIDLRPYLPTSIHGAVLITTRNSESISYGPDSAVHVSNLEEREAVKLLHTIANVSDPPSESESLEIVRELGLLALAITQAGVYIRKTRRLDTYLETFRKHRAQLLRKQPDRDSHYTSSTYTAFDLSFDFLPVKTQEFLKLCAFLHHSLIPISLFEESTRNSFTTHTVLSSCPPPDSDKASISNLKAVLGSIWDEFGFQEIIESASRTSFIDVSSNGLFYVVHPLLQVYIQDHLDEKESQRYRRMTTQLLLGAIRPVKGSNARHWQLLPHTQNILRFMRSEDVAHALALCELYQSLGDWNSCRDLLEFSLPEIQRVQGKKHKDSIWVMGKLAAALDGCGQLDEMEKMEREVLALRLEILGGGHLDTIKAKHNLATTLAARGQWAEAEKMRQEVLTSRLEILGKRHPDTIWAMHNLATTLADRGRWVEAEKMRQEVLSLRLEILGERHPDTIWAMSNLAITLVDRGQWVEAERMRRKVLALRLDILGARHPYTIWAMDNLATTLADRGQWVEAEEIRRDVLTLRLEILGGRHPDTLSAVNNLAITLADRGQWVEAERMRRDVLALRLEILGDRHPDTVWAMQNLATTLVDRGQWVEGERMRRQVLALQLEILGQDHPDTICAMGSLADTLRVSGQFIEAEKMERELLPQQLTIHGRQHPNTIMATNNLAATLYKLGLLEESETMQQEVLALRSEIFGERHPYTVSAMHSLAATLHDRGQWDDAERMQREALVLRLEILGEHHPRTLDTSYNLSLMLYKRDQLEEAATLLQETMKTRVAVFGDEHSHTRDPQALLVDIMSTKSQGSLLNHRNHRFLVCE